MTSSSTSKLSKFKAHLASQRNSNGSGQLETIDYSATPDWDKEVMRLTSGRGAEHIIEVSSRPTISCPCWILMTRSCCQIGGPKTIEKSFACVHRGGTISTCVASAFILTSAGVDVSSLPSLAF